MDNEKSLSESYISIVIHHIAFDGWSVDIFLKELHILYDYYSEEKQEKQSKIDLPILTIQYKDFALWQRRYLMGDVLKKQLDYWKNKLNGYETLNLPVNKPRPNQISYLGRNFYFNVNKNVFKLLRDLAKKLKVSLYTVLLSGYYLMLRSYSSQDDIVVGTLMANRHYKQVENLIGFFVNTLALRVKIDINLSIKDFIKQIGDEVIEAQFYQDLPFEKLVSELNIDKDTSRHPIFQIMFVMQNFGNQERFQGNVKLLDPYNSVAELYNIARFDITTFIDDSGEELRCSS